MTVNVILLLVMGVLYSVGVYLLLERCLTRVLLGIMLLTNGTNLLILHAGGVPGEHRVHQGPHVVGEDVVTLVERGVRFVQGRRSDEREKTPCRTDFAWPWRGRRC